MARRMKPITAPRSAGNTLVITVDPLTVPRGPRLLPRGGTHGSSKHQSRAKAKRQWRRQVEGGRRCVA